MADGFFFVVKAKLIRSEECNKYDEDHTGDDVAHHLRRRMLLS
jgi:hypothetical protein